MEGLFRLMERRLTAHSLFCSSMSAPTSQRTAGSSVKMPTRRRRSPGCSVPLALHHLRTHEAAPPAGGAAAPSLALGGRVPDHGVTLLLVLRSGCPAEVRK